MNKPSDIERTLLVNVVGANAVSSAIDAAGPAIGAFYGEDWKSSPCITRANFGAETVGNIAKTATTVGGYFMGKRMGGGAKSAGGAVGGVLAGDWAKTWVREKVRAEYMKTCKF